MTEGKQSNDTREKVSYILVEQDLHNATAATFVTAYKVEDDKTDKILRGRGGGSESFTSLFLAMISCRRPFSLPALFTHNHIKYGSTECRGDHQRRNQHPLYTGSIPGVCFRFFLNSILDVEKCDIVFRISLGGNTLLDIENRV